MPYLLNLLCNAGRRVEIQEGPLVQCPLRIDKSILYYLMGEPYQDQKLAGIVKPMPVEMYGNASLLPSHQVLAEQLAAAWFQTTDRSTLPIVQLCGFDATAKRAVAAVASQLIGCNLKMMSASVFPLSFNDFNQLPKRWERSARLSNDILLLDCDNISSTDASQIKAIAQFIEDITTPLIVTTRDRLSLPQRSLITFDVPHLTQSEQRHLWLTYLDDSAAQLNGHINSLVGLG